MLTCGLSAVPRSFSSELWTREAKGAQVRFSIIFKQPEQNSAVVPVAFHAKTLSRNVVAIWIKTGGVENQDINSIFGANKEIKAGAERRHSILLSESWSSVQLRWFSGPGSGSDTEAHLTCADLWRRQTVTRSAGSGLWDNPSNSIPGSEQY